MERIVILGSSGSGKSYLARRLGTLLNLDVHHLDTQYWQPGWQHPDPLEFERLNRDLVGRERWIIEGNYSATRAIRLKAADTIVYLHEAPWRCAWRFLWRCWSDRSRPDVPAGCREPRFGRDLLAHLLYILRYRRNKEPKLLAEIDQYRAGREIYPVHGRAGVESFLQSARSRSDHPTIAEAPPTGELLP